jgi:flagellar assembly protein FliH
VLLQSQSEIDEQKKEGYQQGRNEAHVELEDALKATQAMVKEVGEWKTALLAQGEQILVEMLKEMSRKMFGEGVELNKNVLQANLSRIMESANGLGSLNIFLNPKDARMLDSSWVDQYLLITGGQAKIIPSDNITRGGCYVKGSMGTVDGRVETQLDAFLKTFDEASTLAE